MLLHVDFQSNSQLSHLCGPSFEKFEQLLHREAAALGSPRWCRLQGGTGGGCSPRHAVKLRFDGASHVETMHRCRSAEKKRKIAQNLRQLNATERPITCSPKQKELRKRKKKRKGWEGKRKNLK